MRRGIAMAFQAKLHLERFRSPSERHLVDTPVAFDAGDTAIDMDRMVELHIIGQLRHALPADWLPGRKAPPHRLQHARTRPQLRMTAHACVGGGQPRPLTYLHAAMTVAAVDAVIADMMLVTEGDGLVLHPSYLCLVGRFRIVPAA